MDDAGRAEHACSLRINGNCPVMDMSGQMIWGFYCGGVYPSGFSIVFYLQVMEYHEALDRRAKEPDYPRTPRFTVPGS